MPDSSDPVGATSGDPPRNRREAWEAVAERVGGSFREAKVTGGYEVVAPHGPWTLTMDLRMVSAVVTNTMCTRVWAAFVGRDDTRLLVRRRTVFDTIVEKLGLGRTLPGSRQLARRFVVRGRPQSRVRSILGAGLADALAAHRSVRLQVRRAPLEQRKALGGGARHLQVLSPGVDTDVDRMAALFELARETMGVLERAGVTSASSPGLSASRD